MVSIGVDLGGTKCLGVAVDDAGAILDQHRVETPDGAEAVLDALLEVASTLRDRAVGAGGVGVGGVGVGGVGVGLPGLVDRRGRLRFGANLPGVVDLDVAGVLGSRLGVPVVVDNDANCAAWAEHQVGAARGRDDVILVTLGTGVGGGLVLGGRLHRGSAGFAGEIGHMIVDPSGPRCPCGQRGCWERFASGSGLAWLAKQAGYDDSVRGEDITAGAAAGDARAIEVMDRFGWWVALGLANLANAFDPEAFVLGGGLVEAGDVLFAPVRRSFAELVEASDHRPEIPILPAALGEHAGAIGAALLATAGGPP